jgi:hypothetical protein
MYMRRDLEPRILWFFPWKPLLLYFIISTFTYVLYTHPLAAICRDVEIDVKTMLNERDLPPPLVAWTASCSSRRISAD